MFVPDAPDFLVLLSVCGVLLLTKILVVNFVAVDDFAVDGFDGDCTGFFLRIPCFGEADLDEVASVTSSLALAESKRIFFPFLPFNPS